MHVRRATVDDLDFIRETRNAGRYNMTRDTSLIHPYDSEVWWASNPNVWIAEVPASTHPLSSMTPVGYAVLRETNQGTFISLAVAPEHQGKGYGTLIYRHFHPLVKAEIWDWNGPSIRAAEKAGLRELSRADGKVVYGP